MDKFNNKYKYKYIKYKNKYLTSKNAKNYIFVYGSLTNFFIQKILLKNVQSLPPKAILVKESGYKRFWIKGKNNEVSLGIFQSELATDINGVLIEIDSDELINFDKYELNENEHIRKKINWDFIHIDNKLNYLKDNLYVYIKEGEPYKINIVENIPNLYMQTVLDGFRRYGDDYLDLFLATTH